MEVTRGQGGQSVPREPEGREGAGEAGAAGEKEGTPEGDQARTRRASEGLARLLAFTLQEMRSHQGF